MPLLNYTTSVEVEKSSAEIQLMLIRAGASDINLSYLDGQLSGIGFRMATPFGPQLFRLPARVDAVQATLVQQHAAQKGKPAKYRKLERRHMLREQAERVAWRIIKDWLEAQLAIVQTGQAVMDEVMLPYMIAGGKGQSMYQHVVEQGLALPKPKEK